MFILYPLLAAVAVGIATGGRLRRLEHLQLRWLWLIGLAFAVQLALFGPAASVLPGIRAWGPGAYVMSTAVVVGVVLANVRLPGLALVLVGGLANLAALLANGGIMPATSAALRVLGWEGTVDGFSNSAFVPEPALPWLVDIFALPPWLPFANVFSIGDVLIGLGVAWLVFHAMRDRSLDARPA